MDEPINTPQAGDHQPIADTIREAMASRGYTQTEIARQADMSPATLSQFLAGTYRGNRDEVARKLAAWHGNMVAGEGLAALDERIKAYAETPIAKRINGVLALARFGNMVMIGGGSGIGKSMALAQFQRVNTAVWHVQFNGADKSVYAVLCRIARAVGISDVSSQPSQVRRAIVSRIERTQGLLLCDEAQHLTSAGLEIVRSLYDEAEIGVAFVGHLDLADNIAKLPQVQGRVFAPLRIAHASPLDADALFASWRFACKRSREFLRAKANRATGLRGIVSAFTIACSYAAAEGAEVSFDHVTRAWTDLHGSAVAA